MNPSCSRREALARLGALAGAAALGHPLEAAAAKPLRGIIPIMATPYTAAGAVDFEDLAREVEFLEKCGVQGMAWPQLASGYRGLTKEERMRGMEVLAKAAKGRKPALLLGVQSANTEQMLEFARKAEELAPDALIAMPPYEGKTLDDYRAYYAALGKLTQRPVFIQTTGGARGVSPSVEFLVGIAREFPNVAYIKEEIEPLYERMKQLVAAKPVVKGVFSGNDATGLTYEMRFGGDGSMPSAAWADADVAVWQMYQAGQKEKAREAFAAVALMLNEMKVFRNLTQYVMKKRGVFRTAVTRGSDGAPADISLGPEEVAEIDWTFEALRPYLRA
jgi:4-hydroxy-tetrahydrodipicolinate synthase